MDSEEIRLGIGIDTDSASRQAKDVANVINKELKSGLDESVKNAQQAADKEVAITEDKVRKQKALEAARLRAEERDLRKWADEAVKQERAIAEENARRIAEQKANANDAVSNLRKEIEATIAVQKELKKTTDLVDEQGNVLKSGSFKDFANLGEAQEMAQLISEMSDKIKEFASLKKELSLGELRGTTSEESIATLGADEDALQRVNALASGFSDLRSRIVEVNDTAKEGTTHELIYEQQRAEEEKARLLAEQEAEQQRLIELEQEKAQRAEDWKQHLTDAQTSLSNMTNQTVDDLSEKFADFRDLLDVIDKDVDEIATTAQKASATIDDGMSGALDNVAEQAKVASESVSSIPESIEGMSFDDVEIAGVTFSTTEIIEDVNNLKDEISDIIANSTGEESPQLIAMQSQLKNDYQEADRLQTKLEELGAQQIKTDEYVEMEKELQNLEKEADKLYSKWDAAREKMSSLAVEPTEEMKDITSKINSMQTVMAGTEKDSTEYKNAENLLKSYQKYLGMLQDKERERQLANDDNFKKLEQDWANAQIALDEYKSKMTELESSGGAYYSGKETQEYADTASMLDKIRDKMNIHLAKYNELAGGAEKIKLSWGDVLGYILRVQKDGLAQMGRGLQQMGAQVSNLIKGMKRLGDATLKHNALANMSFKKLFRQVLKYGLGIRSTFILFRKIKATIKEDFKLMAEDIPAFGQQIEGLKGSFELFKHSLGSAFEPIASIAIPYITKLLDYLSRLFDMLGQISAAIFGQKTYVKALKQTTSETKKATDAAKGYLSPIDTIHQYTKDKGSGADGGGGGGFYETAQVSDEANSIATKFKQFIADVTDAIKPFTDALKRLWNEGLSKFAGFVWTGLKDFYEHFLVPIGKWMFGEDTGLTRLVDIINAFLNSIDWEELNRSLRDFWDAIAPYATEFGEGLIDFFEDAVTWLKENVIDNLPGLLDSITKVLNDGDPETARKWGYALGAVAVGLFAFKLVSGVVGLFLPILTFLGGLIKLLATPVLAVGGKLFSGLATGLGTALSGLGGIGGLFTQDLGLIFGAGSAAEIGLTIGTGIIGGLAAAFLGWHSGQGWYQLITGDDTDYGSFGEQMSQIVQSIVDGDAGPALQEWWGEIWGGMVAFFTDVWGVISGVLGTVAEFFGSVFSVAWDAVVAVWNGVVDFFGGIWEGIKEIFSVVGNFFKGIFEGAWFTIKTIWGVVVDFFKGIWNGICTAFSAVGSFFKTIFEGAWNGIKFVWEKVTGFFSGVWNGIKDIFSKVGEFFSGIFQGAADAISNIFEGLINIIKAPINFIIDGINLFIEGLNKIQVPDWVPAIGGKGINIPTIPRLAKGAVIPPNREFIAMLGDQKSGTNIEAPLETIKQAMREVVGQSNGNGTVTVNLTLDRRVLAQAVVAEGKVIKATSNTNIFNF